MALDAFMQIDGIKGESTDKDHKDWIELLSFSHAVQQPTSATASSAGGGTTEKANHGDIVVTKVVDKTSPELFKLCSEGKHVKKIEFRFNRSAGDGKRVIYLKYELENVVVSNVALSGAGDLPREEIAFNYGKIRMTYDKQDRAGGGGGGKVVAGWDLESWQAWA
jgi:type VI secretion system secreted protein Hcp